MNKFFVFFVILFVLILCCFEIKYEKRGDKGFNLVKGMINDIMRMF